MNIDDMIDTDTSDMIPEDAPGGRLAKLQTYVWTGRPGSDSQQRYLAELLDYVRRNELDRPQKQALWDIMKDVFARLVKAWRETPESRERLLAMMDAIAGEFELQVTVGDETAYMSSWCAMLLKASAGDPDSEDLDGLLTGFTDAPPATETQDRAFDLVAAYVESHTPTPEQAAAIQAVLMDVLVRDGNTYLADTRQRGRSGPLLIRLCDYLPPAAVVPLKLGEASVAEWQTRFGYVDDLVRAWDSKVGSQDQRTITAKLIESSKAGVDFPLDFGKRSYQGVTRATLQLILAVNCYHDHRSSETRLMILDLFGWPDDHRWGGPLMFYDDPGYYPMHYRAVFEHS